MVRTVQPPPPRQIAIPAAWPHGRMGVDWASIVAGICCCVLKKLYSTLDTNTPCMCHMTLITFAPQRFSLSDIEIERPTALKASTRASLGNNYGSAISAAKKGIRQSEAHKAAISAAKKGIRQSEAHKAAISAAKKGIRQSRQSEAHKAAKTTCFCGECGKCKSRARSQKYRDKKAKKAKKT